MEASAQTANNALQADDTRLEIVACPLCASSDRSSLVWESHSLELEAGEAIVQCRHCSCVYLNPRVREEVLRSEWYDQSKYYDYYEAGSGMVGSVADDVAPHLRLRLEDLERRIGRVGNLLDVGCAHGFFLAYARTKGWTTDGVEVSRHAADHAVRVLGLRVFNGDLHDARFETGRFDVVHMSHVFEHLYRPLEVLAEVRRVLRPGGFLVLEVPNQFWHLTYRLRKLVSQLRGRPTKRPDRNFHTLFFQKRVLRALMEREGYRIVSIEGQTHLPDLTGSTSMVRGMKRMIVFLEKHLSIGENIVVVATVSGR